MSILRHRPEVIVISSHRQDDDFFVIGNFVDDRPIKQTLHEQCAILRTAYVEGFPYLETCATSGASQNPHRADEAYDVTVPAEWAC